jgi:hypothetical protein
MPLFSSPIRNRIVDLAAVTEDSPIRPREQPVIVFSLPECILQQLLEL